MFKRFIIENLPSILTGAAVAGVVETVVLAVKATPKALDILEEKKSEEKQDGSPWNKKDTVKATWKCYIPAAISGVGTVACIVGANHAHISKEAGLAVALLHSIEKQQEYREEAGEKQDQKIMDKIHKKHIVNAKKPDGELKEGMMWCYEPESDQFFQATTEQILWAELAANKTFMNHGELRFNQFLDLLPGAKKVPWGDHFGWFMTDEDGTWDYNWSYYRGTPWIDIQPQISIDDDMMILAYGMHPGDENDPDDIEEPEQINQKPVVVKHS